MFWGYDPTARFDSWLTVGITDGHADSKLSSIGVHQLVSLGLTLMSFWARGCYQSCSLRTIKIAFCTAMMWSWQALTGQRGPRAME